jgi:hypothetical protein
VDGQGYRRRLDLARCGIETVADADDGIVGASSIAFGQGPRDHRSLYGVNFGVFSPVPMPSLFRLPVGVPGAPQP